MGGTLAGANAGVVAALSRRIGAGRMLSGWRRAAGSGAGYFSTSSALPEKVSSRTSPLPWP